MNNLDFILSHLYSLPCQLSVVTSFKIHDKYFEWGENFGLFTVESCAYCPNEQVYVFNEDGQLLKTLIISGE